MALSSDQHAPALDGGDLVALWNSGHKRALAVLLATQRQRDRDRIRREFIARAARLFNEPSLSAFSLAARLRQRMTEIVNSREGFIDLGLVDDALRAALLVGGWEVPAARTFQRSLEP